MSRQPLESGRAKLAKEESQGTTSQVGKGQSGPKKIIPALCRKAGVPRQDSRGNITSHRARSTIASQLHSAKEPMSLFELQEWLGHRSLETTKHYAKITPTKLAKSYADAGYFERNIRRVEVLIDQDAARTGLAAKSEPWKFYEFLAANRRTGKTERIRLKTEPFATPHIPKYRQADILKPYRSPPMLIAESLSLCHSSTRRY